MQTHYSIAEKSRLDTWYPDDQGRFERYGFGFDQRSPQGAKSAAYATYQFDARTNLLTVSATAGKFYSDEAYAELSVKCGDVAQAIDYAARYDAALGEVVRDAVPDSLRKRNFNVPAWAEDASKNGRDLTGLTSRRDIEAVMKLADQAVRNSYRSKASEDQAELSTRSGLPPLEYRIKTDAFWFKNGNDAVFLISHKENGFVVHHSEETADGEFPVMAKGRTFASAIAIAAVKVPGAFTGMVEHGKEDTFKQFCTQERAAIAASARVSCDPRHEPYGQAMRLLRNTPASHEIFRQMQCNGLTNFSPVQSFGPSEEKPESPRDQPKPPAPRR